MTEGHAADKAMYISRRYEQATQFLKRRMVPTVLKPSLL